MKSTTCKGASGQYLSEYHTQHEAEEAATHARRDRGQEFTVYQCRTCHYWHLSPVNPHAPVRQCTMCTDSQLFRKDVYTTREDALHAASYVWQKQKLKLFVYRCPHGNGYHLTKRDPGKKKGGK